jgi:ATP-dependent helicase HrpA
LSLPQQHDVVRRSLERDRELTLLVAAAGFGRALYSEVADRAVRVSVLDPLDSVPRTQREFLDALDRGRAAVAPNAEAIVGVLRVTLQQLRDARARIDALSAPAFERARVEIERHLDRLFAPGWVREPAQEWFERYAKYAEATARRAERARWAPSRHTELEAQVEPFDAALRELDRVSPVTAEAPARVQLRWMIEEFRISLYAQELRTRVPVSAARLTRQLTEARREAAGG